MPMGEATWVTPLVSHRVHEEMWQKLDERSWSHPKMDLDKEISFFNNVSHQESITEYDLYFSYTKTFPLWNIKKSKENRLYLPDVRENIFNEEKDKPIPVLSSMNYGRPCRPPYDFPSTVGRKAAMKEFYRKKGGVLMVKEKKPV